jgi:hypothetical protein
VPIEFSRVERLENGFLVDPRPYVDELPRLRESLPTGAFDFVSDPDHFDISTERSVKDLRIEKIEAVDGFALLGLTVELAYNQLPGVSRLSIAYTEVVGFSIDVTSSFSIPADWITADTKRLGSVLTDEVLPHPQGCRHEIAMIHGSLSVICRDLVATWS